MIRYWLYKSSVSYCAYTRNPTHPRQCNLYQFYQVVFDWSTVDDTCEKGNRISVTSMCLSECAIKEDINSYGRCKRVNQIEATMFYFSSYDRATPVDKKLLLMVGRENYFEKIRALFSFFPSLLVSHVHGPYRNGPNFWVTLFIGFLSTRGCLLCYVSGFGNSGVAIR